MSDFQSISEVSKTTSETIVTVRRTKKLSSQVSSQKSGKIIIVREYDNNKTSEYTPRSAQNETVKDQEPVIAEMPKVIEIQQQQQQQQQHQTVTETSELEKIVEKSETSMKTEVKEEIVASQETKQEATPSTIVRSESSSTISSSKSNWSKSSLVTRFVVSSKASTQKKTFVSPGFGPKRWSIDAPNLPKANSINEIHDIDISDTASNVSEPVYNSKGRRKFTFQVRGNPINTDLSVEQPEESNSGTGPRWEMRRPKKDPVTKQKFKIPTEAEAINPEDQTELSFPSFLDQYRMDSKEKENANMVDGALGRRFTIAGAQTVEINGRQYGIVIHNGRRRFITYLQSEQSSRADEEPEIVTLCDSRPWFCEKYMPAVK